MGKIILSDIRLYAYHGCMDEEAKIGSYYSVDLTVESDLSKAAQSDALRDTLDYTALDEIVRLQMGVRSKLLEHVAQRILDAIGRELEAVKRAEVQVSKLAPPLAGSVKRVSVVLSRSYA